MASLRCRQHTRVSLWRALAITTSAAPVHVATSQSGVTMR